MAVIDVTDLSKEYPGRRGTRALSSVSLRIEEGAVLGLLGENGAGKTTLIKILAGLLVPDAGGGTVLGYDLRRAARQIRASVSLVAPTVDVGIDNNLTVRQNLVFWAPIYGLYGAHARHRIDELLVRLGLETKSEAWPMHISAGQRQRLALARSLLAENRLVFLDEPTNKLDAEGVRSVRDLIAELNQRHGVTVVLTTHVMEEAEELCSEIALLHGGVLVQHQETRSLLRSLDEERPIEVELADGCGAVALPPPAAFPAALRVEAAPGADGAGWHITIWSRDVPATTPAVLDWIRTGGYPVRRMTGRRITLDDVFRALGRTAPESPP
ncbi:MAG: ABC transporter ATP-binding protein [Clostridia bacterium]